MTASIKVGYIGLGSMGKPWATNVAQDGFDLMVYDVRPEPVAELVKLGAKAGHSPREVAAYADIVGITVSGLEAVNAVLDGPDGLLSGAHAGLVVAIQTSLHPSDMEAAAKRIAARGAHALDAQMSGGWTSAVKRKTCLMVGGDVTLLERCRPVFETTASHIFHVGDVGKGAVAKVAQNLITAQYLMAASEGFRLAGKGGVDLGVFQEIVRASSAQSWVADDYLSFWGNRPRPWMYYSVLEEALDLGRTFDVALPGAATASQALSHSLTGNPAGD
ncbi:MAG TPA: NAD(P)-dependent oxidoreductase [Chloroflexota bacterium]|nr:NAD(P)-dependent oxidoreductase [Chloroflexota bacterium]